MKRNPLTFECLVTLKKKKKKRIKRFQVENKSEGSSSTLGLTPACRRYLGNQLGPVHY